MRRILAVAFLVSGLLSPLSAQNLTQGNERLSSFHDQLSSIEDISLRKTLENSIAAGLIESQHDFSAAVSRAEAIANNSSPILYSARGATRESSDLRTRITERSAPLSGLDCDAVKVVKNEDYKREDKLFKDFNGSLPRSYTDALALCEKFNPAAGTNDAPRLEKEIDAFLASISKDPTILHALKVTNTTMADLKKNWFGSGTGFEHVVAGEVKGSKVSGFHWWYRFYNDERNGHADVLSSVAGIGNQKIYTGSFMWDPDGDGPKAPAKKPKGGFINGNSVQSILALGHIAIETAKEMGSVPGSLAFKANLNGESFNWQLYTMNGNIRSLYPMTDNKNGGNFDRSVQEADFYDREQEFLNSTK
ncbi:MAG TPA: hypothetical protein PLM07_12945 [Candidatus Rifleibacterium sp.]|nr:hypothetical protein [Candidatus Rifleibacterium sp.]